MTETGTDPGRRPGHLDADAVADLDEGLLPPAEASLARAHLAGCADCAALDAALSDLRLLLRTAPEPGPVPAEVATRVEDALARAQAAEDLRGAVTERPAARRARAWRPRTLRAVLGGVAAVAAAGLVAVPLLQGTGGGDGGDETVSGAASDSAGASRSGGGVADLAPEYGSSGGYRVMRSGADYRPATLAVTAARLLDGAPPASSSPGVVLADPLARLEDPQAVRACVAAVQALDAAAGGPPIAVDLATYAGLPAAVLLLPLAPPSPGQALAVAVGPSCGTGAEANVRGRAVLTR